METERLGSADGPRGPGFRSVRDNPAMSILADEAEVVDLGLDWAAGFSMRFTRRSVGFNEGRRCEPPSMPTFVVPRSAVSECRASSRQEEQGRDAETLRVLHRSSFHSETVAFRGTAPGEARFRKRRRGYLVCRQTAES